MTEELTRIVSRLEKAVTRLENIPQVSTAEPMKSTCPVGDSPIVIGYQQFLQNSVLKFVEISDKIGGDVKSHAHLVQKAFNAQLEFLKKATSYSKPSDSEVQILLKPTSDLISEIVQFRESNRKSQHFNHLTAISEGISALGWVGITPAPCPYIKELIDASQFYTNRVIKDFKDKDPIHINWTKDWLAILTELQAYVKQHYTTGLTWTGKNTPPAPTIGAPPPPPPPPEASTGADDSEKKAALFAALNKGDAVTSGLRKVTDDMKTHKNPNLRAGSTVPATQTKPDISQKSGHHAKTAPVKPPEMKLEGSKWTVEYFQNKKDIVISDTAIKHTLYVFKCDNCVITVKGKINSIVMDSCKKSAIVFDGLISSLDLVNCQSVQAQTLGALPTVNIDKTDGAQVFLSKESLAAEIVTAKSSEMNIMVPQENGDMAELALPEQFKTKIVNGKLVTACSDDF